MEHICDVNGHTWASSEQTQMGCKWGNPYGLRMGMGGLMCGKNSRVDRVSSGSAHAGVTWCINGVTWAGLIETKNGLQMRQPTLSKRVM